MRDIKTILQVLFVLLFIGTDEVGVHIPEHTRSLSGSLLGYKTIP